MMDTLQITLIEGKRLQVKEAASYNLKTYKKIYSKEFNPKAKLNQKIEDILYGNTIHIYQSTILHEARTDNTFYKLIQLHNKASHSIYYITKNNKVIYIKVINIPAPAMAAWQFITGIFDIGTNKKIPGRSHTTQSERSYITSNKKALHFSYLNNKIKKDHLIKSEDNEYIESLIRGIYSQF